MKTNPENFDDGLTRVAPKEMKLKTLKDIEKLYDLGGEILSEIEHPEIKGIGIIISKAKENRKAFLKHLKQEAIKWIKKIRNVTIYPYGKDIPIIDNNNKFSKFINSEFFIKHFFNIKDEDLKEKK